MLVCNRQVREADFDLGGREFGCSSFVTASLKTFGRWLTVFCTSAVDMAYAT
jgi:hypothetical protein